MKNVWTGHHLKPLSDDLRAMIESVTDKNMQQFIPTLLVGHNTIATDADAIDNDTKRQLKELAKGSLYICDQDHTSSKVTLFLYVNLGDRLRPRGIGLSFPFGS